MHGFPFACISLGLVDHRVPVLGVIYNPFLDHLYYGVRGSGSFLKTPAQPQPQRLPLAPTRPLLNISGALIGVEWGADRSQEAIRPKAESFARLAGAPPQGVMAHSLRTVGSGALTIALVAQGALDMYWFGDAFFLPLSRRTDSCAGRLDPGTSFPLSLLCLNLHAQRPTCTCRPWDVCVRPITVVVGDDLTDRFELFIGRNGDRARSRLFRHRL